MNKPAYEKSLELSLQITYKVIQESDSPVEGLFALVSATANALLLSNGVLPINEPELAKEINVELQKVVLDFIPKIRGRVKPESFKQQVDEALARFRGENN